MAAICILSMVSIRFYSQAGSAALGSSIRRRLDREHRQQVLRNQRRCVLCDPHDARQLMRADPTTLESFMGHILYGDVRKHVKHGYSIDICILDQVK